jgi:hypothetical protein
MSRLRTNLVVAAGLVLIASRAARALIESVVLTPRVLLTAAALVPER